MPKGSLSHGKNVPLMGHSCTAQLDILPQVVCRLRLSETKVWLVGMFPTTPLPPSGPLKSILQQIL